MTALDIVMRKVNLADVFLYWLFYKPVADEESLELMLEAEYIYDNRISRFAFVCHESGMGYASVTLQRTVLLANMLEYERYEFFKYSNTPRKISLKMKPEAFQEHVLEQAIRSKSPNEKLCINKYNECETSGSHWTEVDFIPAVSSLDELKVLVDLELN